jgi:DNA-binding NarL/FixJ family response regulator
VLLVHDHTLVRAGLRLLIESQHELTVVAEAESYAEAINLTRQRQPDVILFDHAIGREDGLEHIPVLLEASSRSKVLVLTSANEPELSQRALCHGAFGLIDKDEEPALLVKAIKKVTEGEAWVDRATVGRLITEMSRNGMAARGNDGPLPDQINSLTRRERDIVQLIAQGLKNKQIAERLSISDVTVRHHLTSTFDKLGVSDRFELMIYAYKHHICDLPK